MISYIKNTALVVIDVQSGLFHKSIPIYKAEQLLDTLCSLIERAHQSGVQVIFIQHESLKVLPKGKPEWQFHPRLHPQEVDLVIHKQHPSAFEDTDLKEELEKRGIIRLVLCGLVTHGCVKATTLDAVKLGYEVNLVGDGHSSFSTDAARLIVKWNKKLAQAGAMVSLAREVSF